MPCRFGKLAVLAEEVLARWSGEAARQRCLCFEELKKEKVVEAAFDLALSGEERTSPDGRPFRFWGKGGVGIFFLERQEGPAAPKEEILWVLLCPEDIGPMLLSCHRSYAPHGFCIEEGFAKEGPWKKLVLREAALLRQQPLRPDLGAGADAPNRGVAP